MSAVGLLDLFWLLGSLFGASSMVRSYQHCLVCSERLDWELEVLAFSENLWMGFNQPRPGIVRVFLATHLTPCQ